MARKRGLVTVLAALYLGLHPLSAPADIIQYDASKTGVGQQRNNGPYTVGHLIQIGSTPIIVSHLGVQDVVLGTHNATGNGFVRAPVSVAVWTADGATLLASATVASGDQLIDAYRYSGIAGGGTFTFAANTQYLLGAHVGSGIEPFYDDMNANPNPGEFPYSGAPGVTLIQARFNTAAGLAAPITSTDTPGRWGPANATFIPEPATAGILGLAAVLLLQGRRRGEGLSAAIQAD